MLLKYEKVNKNYTEEFLSVLWVSQMAKHNTHYIIYIFGGT